MAARSLGRLHQLCSQLCAAAGSVADDRQLISHLDDDEDEKQRLAFQQYCEEGKARALALGNRGPIRYGPDGKLAQEILDSYYEHGFYVLEGVVKGQELEDFQQEFGELVDNAPATMGGKVDSSGRPVKHPKAYSMNKPLSDPVGGTSKIGIWDWKRNAPYLDKWGKTGRNHLKMREPRVPPEAPEVVPGTIGFSLLISDCALRIYGHPDLLRVAEALSGPDMTPFTENFFVKPPFFGTSTAWHQDPSSAWDTEGWGEPGFDLGQVGFNFHLSIYRGTPENTLWFMPGSPKMGRVDMESLSRANGGTDMLPGAVPVLCEPGDVYIQSRLGLHCAFPNQSPDWRATFQWGFHRKTTVLGKTMNHAVYTEEYIRNRSRMVQLAIDCRRQKYPEETPYVYLPFKGCEDECRWHQGLKENQYDMYWKNSIPI